MKLLGRLFKKRTPEPPVDVGPKRTPWTAEEDRLVLAARAMPVADRTLRGGESELQALARKLGRSPEAVTDRRSRLADPGLRDQLASERREREERDRKIIQLVSHGASLGEAAGRSGCYCRSKSADKCREPVLNEGWHGNSCPRGSCLSRVKVRIRYRRQTQT